MKYIKSYENILNNNIQIGDYVYCNEKTEGVPEDALFFINNNIGKVVQINKGYDYTVKYYNIPENIKRYFIRFNVEDCRGFDYNEIIYHSKNKQELKAIISQNKYNL